MNLNNNISFGSKEVKVRFDRKSRTGSVVFTTPVDNETIKKFNLSPRRAKQWSETPFQIIQDSCINGGIYTFRQTGSDYFALTGEKALLPIEHSHEQINSTNLKNCVFKPLRNDSIVSEIPKGQFEGAWESIQKIINGGPVRRLLKALREKCERLAGRL